MAKERSNSGPRPNDTFRQAALKIIRPRLAEMWQHLPGTIAGEDVEELHQMRVASRRLRAAVDICAPCFPPKRYAGFRQEVAEVTDALGGVRDCDVLLEFLIAERESVGPEEEAGIDDMIALITARREALRPGMIAHLSTLGDTASRQAAGWIGDGRDGDANGG